MATRPFLDRSAHRARNGRLSAVEHAIRAKRSTVWVLRTAARMGAVNERHAPILQPPLTFAHRGATAQESENSQAAFELALRLGATGLRSDVRLSGDGVAILINGATFRRGLRRHAVRELPLERLDGVLGVQALFGLLGRQHHVWLDIDDDAAIGPVVDAARRHEERTGVGLLDRLWLGHADWQLLAGWRERFPGLRLVNTGRLQQMQLGPERRAAQLGDAGIDAMAMPYSDWTGGLVILFRRFDVLAAGSEAEHDRMLDDLFRMGVDAVCSTHVDRMTEALRRAGWELPTGS